MFRQSIKIKDTNIGVTDGMVVPTWTVLQIDSVTTATGLCTGMAWANTSEPSCQPTGFVWNRNPSHTYLWADISTATALNGTYPRVHLTGNFVERSEIPPGI